ncbi:hypothetical protein J1N41_20820 [Providencia rettgeri]|nr:hypothetical protein [Providencia rettgeri]
MTDKYLCFSCNKELGEQDKAFIFDVDYSENPCAENTAHCSEECFYRSTGRASEYRKILERRGLRDNFAMAAMQGILANPAQLDNVNDNSAEWVSRDAYLVADAMLKARG